MIDVLRRRPSSWSPLAAAALTIAAGYRVPTFVPDSDLYIALAVGDRSAVPAPFSQRVAHPAVARLLVELGLSTPVAFAAVAVVCVLAFFVVLRLVLRSLTDVEYLLVSVIPAFVLVFREAYLPDLFFATAVAGLILLLRHESYVWWAVAAIPVLFVVRESTLLVGVVLAVVLWRTGRRRISAAAALATVAGYLLSGLLGAAGASSKHDVGGPLYLAAKIPYNGIKNLTGFSIYTNDTVPCVPIWTTRLPTAVGSITEAGFCPFDPVYLLATMLAWSTLFGTMPAVLVALRRRYGRRITDEPWLRVALWLGVVSFVTAPLLGASVRRLATYGWPAMVVVAPVVLALILPAARRLRILALSFAACWLPVVLDLVLDGTAGLVVAIVASLSLHVVTYRLTHDGSTGRIGPVQPDETTRTPAPG